MESGWAVSPDPGGTYRVVVRNDAHMTGSGEVPGGYQDRLQVWQSNPVHDHLVRPGGLAELNTRLELVDTSQTLYDGDSLPTSVHRAQFSHRHSGVRAYDGEPREVRRFDVYIEALWTHPLWLGLEVLGDG